MPATTLRPGDARIAPLVCVHPVSGRADAYQELAGLLGWRGPVLGIGAPDPVRVERLADLAGGRWAE
jgi:thioesterase domain-containing protein